MVVLFLYIKNRVHDESYGTYFQVVASVNGYGRNHDFCEQAGILTYASAIKLKVYL